MRGPAGEAMRGRVRPEWITRRISEMRAFTDRRGLDIGFLVPLAVLAILVAAITIDVPAFLGIDSLQTTGVNAAPILLIAFGNTFVILTGGIDLSGGAVATLASVLAAKWLPAYGSVGGIVLILALATALGAIQGYIQATTQIPSFVVTLGGMSVFTGLALKISNGTDVFISQGMAVLNWLNETMAAIPNSLLVVVVVLVVASAGLRWTGFGRSIYALGAAEPAARIAGVRATRLRIGVFAASALFAALGGICVSSQTLSGSPVAATSLLLPSIAAVILGGTAVSGGVGSLGRTLLGGLIVVTVQAGTVVTGLSPAYQNVLFGIAVVIVVSITVDRRRLAIIK